MLKLLCVTFPYKWMCLTFKPLPNEFTQCSLCLLPPGKSLYIPQYVEFHILWLWRHSCTSERCLLFRPTCVLYWPELNEGTTVATECSWEYDGAYGGKNLTRGVKEMFLEWMLQIKDKLSIQMRRKVSKRKRRQQGHIQIIIGVIFYHWRAPKEKKGLLLDGLVFVKYLL